MVSKSPGLVLGLKTLINIYLFIYLFIYYTNIIIIIWIQNNWKRQD